MFTGIIREVGCVTGCSHCPDRSRLVISAESFHRLSIGDSAAIDGVCLTVTELRDSTAWFDVIGETLRRTTLKEKAANHAVNVELPLTLSELIHGHLVQGHVDGVAEVLEIRNEGDSRRLLLSTPEPARRFIVEKGSVAVNGVSLTIGEVTTDTFAVYLIPHTIQETTLKSVVLGDRVNIEADCIAKHLFNLSAPYRAA